MEKLRNIPKMDEFLKDKSLSTYKNMISRKKVTDILRKAIEDTRHQIISGEEKNFDRKYLYEKIIKTSLEKINLESSGRLQKVINATGIIIHTNLGRSPLSKKAYERVLEIVSNYNNLEYSIEEGKRKSRLAYVEKQIIDLTGAEAALVVNNNAAAVFLSLNSLCKNNDIILSRGEMVEIGDSFRILEIIKTSGCNVIEVGSTNRTKLVDYENAITEKTSMLLKVHTSNYKIVGYTEEVESRQLVELGKKHSLITMEDMGSGVLTDLSKHGFKYERMVQDAIEEGIDIVTFSGDKLLGGPQAGIVVGKKEYIDKMKRNQILRCLRIDKMCLAALEATFCHYFENEIESIKEIPTLKNIFMNTEEVFEKANKLFSMIVNSYKSDLLNFEIKTHYSQFGGGSIPFENIESFGIYITSENFSAKDIETILRIQETPIIATVQNEQVILDLRTIEENDFYYIAKTIKESF